MNKQAESEVRRVVREEVYSEELAAAIGQALSRWFAEVTKPAIDAAVKQIEDRMAILGAAAKQAEDRINKKIADDDPPPEPPGKRTTKGRRR